MLEVLFIIIFLDNYNYKKVNEGLLIAFLVFTVLICLLMISSHFPKNFVIEHSMRFEIKYTFRLLTILFLIPSNIFIISLAFRSHLIFSLISVINIILSIEVVRVCVKTVRKFVLLKRAKLIVNRTNYNKIPICPNCKKENPDKAKICVHCGVDFVNFINSK